MNEEKRPEPESTPAITEAEVTIYYEKAASHHTVRADGFWAGITPQLDIEFAAYNDLHPMPRKVKQQVTSEGGLGKEVDREIDTGILREVSVTVVMNPVTAKQFMKLLEAMIKQIDAALEPKLDAGQTTQVS